MLRNNAKICAKRVESIIKKDKKLSRDDSLCEVVKSDFINILSNYADVEEDAAEVTMIMKGENNFELIFKTKCVRIKNFFEC